MNLVKTKGSILITALAVMAITASIAAMLLIMQSIEVKKTQLLITQDKLFGYAQGVEAWAMGVLKESVRERKKNEGYDDLTQAWAQPMLPTGIDDGMGSHVVVSGKIIDLQGLFNVNTLLFEENDKLLAEMGNKSKKIPEELLPERVFERLLEQLPAFNGEELLAESITRAIVGWVGGGEEGNTHLEASYAYSAAQRSLLSVSELRLIKGITASLMQQLLHVVCAIPFIPGAEDDTETLTKVNINTTSPQVLSAILNITPEKAIDLLAERPYLTKEAVTTAINKLDMKNISPKAISTWLDVKSEYFLIESKAHMGRYEATWYTLVYRSTEGAVETLYRMRGVY